MLKALELESRGSLETSVLVVETLALHVPAVAVDEIVLVATGLTLVE